MSGAMSAFGGKVDIMRPISEVDPPNLLCPSRNTFVRHEFESHNKSLADVQNKRVAVGRHDLIGCGARICARHAGRWRARDYASASNRSGKGEREKAAAAAERATATTASSATAAAAATGAAAILTAGTGATTRASGSTAPHAVAAATGAAAIPAAGTGATTGASSAAT